MALWQRFRTKVTFCFCLALFLTCAQSLKFNPCSDLTQASKGDPFVIGIAYWPGAVPEVWGDENTGLNPCDAGMRDNLTAAGVKFAVYNARVDRLTVLKTSFAETRNLLGLTVAKGAPPVVTAVAFRGQVRSEARYLVSFDSNLTTGIGFVTSLALIGKFEKGDLKYLQWYNMTCNECGGRKSISCLNATSCALPPQNCTCADLSESGNGRRLLQANATNNSTNITSNSTTSNSTTPAPSSGSKTCNFSEFEVCATSINMAWDGSDKNTRVFSTASQVKRLNSFSLVSLFFQGKEKFLDATSVFSTSFNTYSDSFGGVNQGWDQQFSAYAET